MIKNFLYLLFMVFIFTEAKEFDVRICQFHLNNQCTWYVAIDKGKNMSFRKNVPCYDFFTDDKKYYINNHRDEFNEIYVCENEGNVCGEYTKISYYNVSDNINEKCYDYHLDNI